RPQAVEEVGVGVGFHPDAGYGHLPVQSWHRGTALRFRAMPIVPDTKDWTWVIDRRCPECGFDGSTVRAEEVAGLIRGNARAWQGVVGGGGAPGRPPAQ